MAVTFNNTSSEADRRKKALAYTAGICGALLILFFLISWKTLPAAPPMLEELIEVNLGNFDEGEGEVQPLIKGEPGPTYEEPKQAGDVTASQNEDENVIPDDNADDEAAAVVKNIKPAVKKVTTPAPVTATIPKPAKPKLTYNGPGRATGNNPDEDNGYRYQGNKPGGTGDAGDPAGNKDSYGNSPGGKIGSGPRVRGNRKIVRHYAFTGDLKKATIYAIVKVSPAGVGTFVSFDKGSTSRAAEYAQAIRNYLRNIQFDKSSEESTVQVQFNFNES